MEIADVRNELLLSPSPRSCSCSVTAFDWIDVASRYSGIEIAPYQWKRRIHPSTFWYYTWDCASGCIWDLSAIKKFEVARGIEL